MKKPLLIVVLFVTTISFSQITKSLNIEKLKKEIIRIETEIQIKTDSLNVLKNEFKRLENIEIIANIKNSDNRFPTNGVVRREGKIRKSPKFSRNSIGLVKQGQKIQLLDYKNKYWKIKNNNIIGYLSDMYVADTDELLVLKKESSKLEEIENIEAEKIRKVEQEKLDEFLKIKREKRLALEKQKIEENNKKLIKKYGAKTFKKLVNKQFWIGMTNEMTKISLGKPDKINRSVGSWGVHEQWVYGSTYLYFENSILTSYQN